MLRAQGPKQPVLRLLSPLLKVNTIQLRQRQASPTVAKGDHTVNVDTTVLRHTCQRSTVKQSEKAG